MSPVKWPVFAVLLSSLLDGGDAVHIMDDRSVADDRRLRRSLVEQEMSDEDNAGSLAEQVKGHGPDTSLTIAGDNQVESWQAEKDDCKKKDGKCEGLFPNECSWETPGGTWCCSSSHDKCPSSYDPSTTTDKVAAPETKVPTPKKAEQGAQTSDVNDPHSSAEDDLAVIIAQPCSDSPEDTMQAALDAGLLNNSFDTSCDGEAPPAGNGTMPGKIFRLVPIAEMTPEEKGAVAKREAKVIKEMEAVANKTMKAMMAKQISDKVKCVADAKEAQLKQLRAQMQSAPVQQKVQLKLAEAKAMEVKLETVKTAQVSAAKTVEDNVQKLECLKKAAAKAEVNLKQQATAKVSSLRKLEVSLNAAQQEAEDAQDNLTATMKSERKKVSRLKKESCKTLQVAKKAQLQAVAAQRELQAAKAESKEIVQGTSCDASPPCDDQSPEIMNAVGQLMSQPAPEAPPAASGSPPAVAGGITLNGVAYASSS